MKKLIAFAAAAIALASCQTIIEVLTTWAS